MIFIQDINLNMKIDAQLMDDGQLIGDVHFIEFTCSAFGAFSSTDATPRKYVFQLPLYAKVKVRSFTRNYLSLAR